MRQRPYQWIKEHLRTVSSPKDLYDMYDEFQADTESKMSKSTFKRAVRKAAYHHAPVDHAGVQIMEEAEGPNRTIVTKSHQIRTLEQLLAFCNVDLSLWKVQKHIINMWGGAANPNFQVKAWLQRIDESDTDPREEIEELIEDAKRYAPVYPKMQYSKPEVPGNLLEISLFDHHFGQLSWGDETGSAHYDTKIAAAMAVEAVDYILSNALANGGVDRIVLLVGNDFFNVNGSTNATFAGTPQQEDGRWQKTFINGRKLWVEIIERCAAVAPVDVIVVPGNHDTERIFYLGDALSCWFHNAPDVTVDNRPTTRKYYEWGQCLIGYTHGHLEPKGSLVNIMSTEVPMAWSRTSYREWHKGHLHAAKETAFQVLDEYRGIREWVMPSLVALDDYHAGKGYASLRETIGNIWNKERGKVAMIMYHPALEDVHGRIVA